MLLAKKTNHARRGFTLTEAAIVLGIAGLIMGAIWVAASSVYESFRVSQTSDQLIQIVQSVRTMHSTQSTVDTAITAELVAQAGGIPSDMIERNADGSVNDVKNIFGGDVEINDYDVNSTADGFSISFTAIPQSACTNILVRNTGTGRDTGLVGAGSAAANNTDFPLTLTDAIGSCTDVDSNTIVFTFRLKG